MTAVSVPGTAAPEHQTLKGECKELVCSKDQVILLSQDAVWTRVSTDTIKLDAGVILVATQSPVNVETSLGSVHLRGDAVAMIRFQNEVLSITNLSTFNRKSLQISSSGRLIETGVGTQTLLTTEQPTYRTVFQMPAVGQRDIKGSQLSDHLWLTVSNPSLNEILEKEPLVTGMANDGQPNSEHKLWQRIAKTAACISAVMGEREVFSHLKR
jgi:hypothetical protein